LDAQIEELRRHATTTLSDAMDRLGIAGQAFGIAPLDRRFRLVGPAFTVRTIPVATRAGASVGDYIDEVPAGSIVVLDNGGRLDATVWGDILTIVAHRRGLGGTVIHGVCRDAARSLELGYPIFSRGVFMRTGKDRVRADGYQVPVSLGDVRVEPGDMVVGDGDGGGGDPGRPPGRRACRLQPDRRGGGADTQRGRPGQPPGRSPEAPPLLPAAIP